MVMFSKKLGCPAREPHVTITLDACIRGPNSQHSRAYTYERDHAHAHARTQAAYVASALTAARRPTLTATPTLPTYGAQTHSACCTLCVAQ